MKLEHDLAYARLAMPDLEKFLLSKEIFWPLPSAPTQIGQPGLEQLSLGLLRVCVARLQATAENEEATQLAAQMTEVRGRWRSNWSKKAVREFGVRIAQWRRALDDLREHPAAYRREIRLRVILELLREDMLPGDEPVEYPVLVGLDHILRGSGRPGSFVWDEGLQTAFPDLQFWFLYWDLKSVESRHAG